MNNWHNMTLDERAEILRNAGCDEHQIDAWVTCEYSHIEPLIRRAQEAETRKTNIQFFVLLAVFATVVIGFLWVVEYA